MWRGHMGKNILKTKINVGDGSRSQRSGTANDYGVINCKMRLTGAHENSPPDCCPSLSQYSFIVALLFLSFFSIIFVFLGFHSYSVLYKQYRTWNSTFRVCPPRLHSHQFWLTNSALVASPFVYHTTSEIAISTTVIHIAILLKDGQLYVIGISRGVRRGQTSASRS